MTEIRGNLTEIRGNLTEIQDKLPEIQVKLPPYNNIINKNINNNNNNKGGVVVVDDGERVNEFAARFGSENPEPPTDAAALAAAIRKTIEGLGPPPSRPCYLD